MENTHLMLCVIPVYAASTRVMQHTDIICCIILSMDIICIRHVVPYVCLVRQDGRTVLVS